MFRKARTVTALFLITVVASLAVSLGAASRVAASPIDLLNQLKLQMQAQQAAHSAFCSNLMDRMIMDANKAASFPTSTGYQDLATDRSIAIANNCPFI
jgi:hypothetical protein